MNYDSKVQEIQSSASQEKGGKVDSVLLADKTPADTRDWYDKWAHTYEEDLEKVEGGYHNPKQAVECLTRFVHDKSAKILDVACGTGWVALQLREKGFTKIDGLDGSEQMLEYAKKRGVYDHYFCELVGPERMANVEDGSYDCLVTTGSFLPGHMDAKCLRTIGRAVRSGGYISICLREAILEHPQLRDIEPTMKTLEEEGFWKMEHRAQFDNYYNNLPGVEYAFRKL